MIQAIGLTSAARRKHPPRVDDLTFEARSGEVTVLLGPAGSGKSEALRLMLQLVPGRGVALFRGRTVQRIPHPAREIGVLLGDVPGHPARTALGHLRMLTAVAGVPVGRADEVLEVVGLSGLADQQLGSFSLGMDRRLGMAAALLGDPHTLVLDEPTRGLSPREAGWLRGLLRGYAAQGGLVMATSRDPKEAVRIADRVVTIDGGRLVADQRAIDFSRTRLRPRVAVWTPHAERFAAVLSQEARSAERTRKGRGAVEVVCEGGSRVSVYGSNCAAVGESAYRHGILVHQLTDEVGDAGDRDRPALLDRADGWTSGRPATAPEKHCDSGGKDDPNSVGRGGRSTGLPAESGNEGAAAEGGEPTVSGYASVPAPSAYMPGTTGDAALGAGMSYAGEGVSSPAPGVGGESGAGAEQPGTEKEAVEQRAGSTRESMKEEARSEGALVPAAPDEREMGRAGTATRDGHPSPQRPTGISSAASSTPSDPERGEWQTDDSAEVSGASMKLNNEPSSDADVQSPDSLNPPGTFAEGQSPEARGQRRGAAGWAEDPKPVSVRNRTPAVAVPGGDVRDSAFPTTRALGWVFRLTPLGSASADDTGTPKARFSGWLKTSGADGAAENWGRRVVSALQRSVSGTVSAQGPDRAAGWGPAEETKVGLPSSPVVRQPGPIAPVRYEMRRLFGVRTPWVLIVLALLSGLAVSVVVACTGAGRVDDPATGIAPGLKLLTGWPPGSPFLIPPAALGAGLLGATAFGQEFRYPALVPAQVPVPRRLGLLAAKLLVTGGVAATLCGATALLNGVMLTVLFGVDSGVLSFPGDSPGLASLTSLSAPGVLETGQVVPSFGVQVIAVLALCVGCAWAGLLGAGVFRSTTLGAGTVVAVPLLVAPLVRGAAAGSEGQSLEGFPGRLRSVLLFPWPSDAEKWGEVAGGIASQPMGRALALSLTVLFCAYGITSLRSRPRQR